MGMILFPRPFVVLLSIQFFLSLTPFKNHLHTFYIFDMHTFWELGYHTSAYIDKGNKLKLLKSILKIFNNEKNNWAVNVKKLKSQGLIDFILNTWICYGDEFH